MVFIFARAEFEFTQGEKEGREKNVGETGVFDLVAKSKVANSFSTLLFPSCPPPHCAPIATRCLQLLHGTRNGFFLFHQEQELFPLL